MIAGLDSVMASIARAIRPDMVRRGLHQAHVSLRCERTNPAIGVGWLRIEVPPVSFDSPVDLTRERAVPCRVLGCTNTTWNVTALCGRHLESEEPVAPRRLTAVDLAVRSGDVDVPPVGAHPPADRGHTLTA